jgi:2-polyprenyl-3-methyl-5-hydroxy-6-metoxy-1,4-benzoquinol methylase
MSQQKQYRRLIQLINQLEVQIYEPLYDSEYTNAGHWDYVVYDHAKFFDHLHESHYILGQKKGLKFIDVGCGLGTKVSLAKAYFDSYGLELNEKYAQVANKINRPKKFNTYGRYKRLKNDKQRIKCMDALKEDYSNYDVIYFFRPISHMPTQKKLEKLIFSTAKEGAIILPIYAQSKFPNYIKKLPTPSGELYVKCENPSTFKNYSALCREIS